MNDNGTMVQVAVTDLAAYFDDEITAMPNLTSVGTLTALQVDNININGNTIISSDTNGHINLTPNGTGEVNISKVDIDAGDISGTDITVGSGKTLNVSAGTLTTSQAQKLAIVEGVGADTDIGSHGFRASTLTADSQTSGRVAIYGTNGLLTEDSDLTFSGDTLTATKLGAFTATGAINFDSQNMTNVDIDSGAIDGTNIGANSAGTGAFTTLTASGTITSSLSGGEFSTDANGHITSFQKLDVATAGGRFIGKSNRGVLGQIMIEQTADSTDGGYIRFATSPSGSTTPTEKMRIDSSGNVGLGGSPVSMLHLRKASGEFGIRLTNDATGHTTGDGGFIHLDTNNDLDIGTKDSTNFFLKTNNTQRIKIQNDGDILFGDVGNSRHLSLDYSNGDVVANVRLGVGAVPDSTELIHAQKDQSAFTRILVENESTSSTSQALFGAKSNAGTINFGITPTQHSFGGDAIIYNTANTGLQIATNNTTRMIIDSSGTVSIGSIADEGDAIITNGADGGRYDVLTVQENGNERWNLSFEGNGSTNSLTLNSNSTSNIIHFAPAGNVGIGTDSPDAKFHVSGQSKFQTDSEPVIIIAGSEGATDHTNENSALCIDFRNLNTANGVASGIVGLDKDGLELTKILLVTDNHDANDGSIRFHTSTDSSSNHLLERMHIAHDGKVGIGTSSVGASCDMELRKGGATSGGTNAGFRFRLARNVGDLNSGDQIGQIAFSNNNDATGGIIQAKADADWSTNDYPTRLEFYTTPDGSGDVAERMRIDSSGNLTVNMNTTGFTAIKGSAIVALADDASISVNIGDNQFIMISENTLGRGALFHCTFPQATPNKLSDPNSIYAAADSDGDVCVFSSANSSTVTIKNRLGAQHNFRIMVFGV
jgi:hypothetical protein